MWTEIDGSLLEGGGQILRMAISLSVLRSIPIKVSKIRAGRSKPGLAAQHLTGIQLARDLSKAKLQGDVKGSTEISFKPNTPTPGDYFVDTGTAGSICLLFQVALPCCLFTNGPTSLQLRGGTNADMAPQIDHTINVLQPILKLFGVNFQLNLVQRGFFPAGQGIVKIQVDPVQELKPILLTDFGQISRIYGTAFVSGVLPLKMADEMALTAKNIIRKSLNNITVDIKSTKYTSKEAFGNGSGINIFAETTTGCILSGSSLGNRKISPEEVGKLAAEELLESVNRKVCVDQHLQDQVIIFMALANGKSRVLSGPITLHTKTAIHVCQLLTKAKFNIIELINEQNIIECEGIGQKAQHVDKTEL